jgi:MFS transporter, DHA2 family, multidrug resistance protein
MARAADNSGVINRAMITATVMLATLMQALDTTIANVALPYMQGSLSATSDQINWVLTSYIVAAAIITPATGWLEARFGRKPLFLTAVIGFIVTSMLCGAAVSLAQIVVFRLLQGIFGAPLVPLSQSVLLDAYPREQQGQAMAVFGLGVMLGPILGPTLGGGLTDSYSWRWVFYVNVPFGVLCALGILLFLGRRADRPLAGRLDWLGFATLSLGIGALQLFLDRGERLDWFASREIQLEAALCVLGFYLFTVHTLSARDPFIDPALFRDRNFVIGIILIFIVGVVLLATLALLTPYLETLMNYPVLTAGLVLAPRGCGTMLAMVMAGQLLRYVDPRLLIAVGLGITGFALYLMTGFTPDVSQGTLIRRWWPLLILGMIILGSGGGLLNGDTQKAIMGVVPRERAGMASGISTTSRFSGILFGFVVLSTIMAIVARAALTTSICASIASRCEAATEFARLVAAGDVPKAVALISPVSPTIANEIAHRGYATGFVAALLTAAAVAGLSAVVVAIQMRSRRARSSSQTAFAVVEEDRSVSKPIVSAASVRGVPLVFDATRTPDAAAGGAEREVPCSA